MAQLQSNGQPFKPGQLFDPLTFSPEQAKLLTNIPGQSLSRTNTAEQIAAAQAITPETLTKTAPFPLQAAAEVPTFPVSTLDSASAAAGSLALTEQEKKQSQVAKDLAEANKSKLGKSAFQLEQEAKFGVGAAQAGINELASKLTALKNEAAAIPLQGQTRAAQGTILTGGLAADENQRLRDNAVAALGVSSLLAAFQGQLANAQDLADRAVAQKYDPIEEQINMLKENLQLIIDDPETTIQDKNRAIRQQEIQDAKAAQVAQDKANLKEVYDLGLIALKYGADLATVQRMQAAKTPQDAIALGGQFLKDPKAKYELEAARLDNVLKSAQIAETRARTSEIGQPTKAEREAADKVAEAAKSTIPVLTDKLGLIDSLLSSSGLKSSVGPSALSRTAILAGLTGSKQNFIAGVQQLVSQDTLDTLLNLKAQGGTLGALSDGEGRLLASAASKIGTWTVKDEKGNVTGYNASEADFKRELNIIKDITKRALEKAGGKVLDASERAALSTFFNTSPTGSSMDFSAENYFR